MTDCPLCEDKLNNNQLNGIYTMKKCNHKFHKDCISKLYTDYCPLCRTKIGIIPDLPLNVVAERIFDRIGRTCREASEIVQQIRDQVESYRINEVGISEEFIQRSLGIAEELENLIRQQQEQEEREEREREELKRQREPEILLKRQQMQAYAARLRAKYEEEELIRQTAKRLERERIAEIETERMRERERKQNSNIFSRLFK